MRWYKQKLGRWRRYMEAQGVANIEQITVGHPRAFLVEFQGTIADAENPRKPANAEGRTVSDLTVHGYAQVVKTCCRWLYQEELLDKDPSARLAMPKVGKDVIKAFTVEHLEAMLGACDTSKPLGFRDYAMIALMADTGIRLGELIRLTVDNFSQVNAQGKSHIKVLGKGKREREVGVSPQVAKLLWKYLRLHRQPRDPAEKRIFIGRHGQPLGKRGVEDAIERVRDAAGIAGEVRCPPHTFRHTFSRRPAASGWVFHLLDGPASASGAGRIWREIPSGAPTLTTYDAGRPSPGPMLTRRVSTISETVEDPSGLTHMGSEVGPKDLRLVGRISDGAASVASGVAADHSEGFSSAVRQLYHRQHVIRSNHLILADIE